MTAVKQSFRIRPVKAEFLVFTFFFHFNPSANIMKVGCRLIISTFRTELSPNSPCIAALKTEMFGTFIFKHAQATKSHGVGIKSANSICCPELRAIQAIILCLGTLLHISACLDRHLIMKILDFFSAMLIYLPSYVRSLHLALLLINNKEQPASLSSSSNDQLPTDSPSSSIAAEPSPSLRLNGSPLQQRKSSFSKLGPGHSTKKDDP